MPYCVNPSSGDITLPLLPDQITLDTQNVIYVSKTGDDGNTGLTVNDPKLTLTSARDAAINNNGTGSPPASNNPIKIEILDAGIYSENLSLLPFLHFYAPSASIIGTLSVNTNSKAVVFAHYASQAGQPVLEKIGNDGHGFYQSQILEAAGVDGSITGNSALRIFGSDSILFAYCGVVYVSAGGYGLRSTGSGFTHAHVWTPDLYLREGSTGIRTENTDTDIIVTIDHILKLGTVSNTVGIESTNNGAIIKVTATEIVADTAIRLTNGTVHVQSSKINGDITTTAGDFLYINTPFHSGNVAGAGTIQGNIGNAIYGPHEVRLANFLDAFSINTIPGNNPAILELKPEDILSLQMISDNTTGNSSIRQYAGGEFQLIGNGSVKIYESASSPPALEISASNDITIVGDLVGSTSNLDVQSIETSGNITLGGAINNVSLNFVLNNSSFSILSNPPSRSAWLITCSQTDPIGDRHINCIVHRDDSGNFYIREMTSSGTGLTITASGNDIIVTYTPTNNKRFIVNALRLA